jgi:hypothetical protein
MLQAGHVSHVRYQCVVGVFIVCTHGSGLFCADLWLSKGRMHSVCTYLLCADLACEGSYS